MKSTFHKTLVMNTDSLGGQATAVINPGQVQGMAAVTSGKHLNTSLDELCINTMRFLAVDAVQNAQSGHLGMPMGSAAMAYALWDRLLKFNPRDPAWPDRDRFVLSAGHACLMLYSLLQLTGFDLPLDEIKQFRHGRECLPACTAVSEAFGIR